MRTNKLTLLLAFILAPARAFSEVREIPIANFGGGVNYKSDCSEIADNQSCDESNMISDFLGTAFKRNGSRRHIAQAISTNPITSSWRAYQSSGTTIKKATVISTWDGLFKSTSEVFPFWVRIASGLAHNQHYSFTTMKNNLLLTGDKLTDPILQLDIVNNLSTPTPLISYDGSTQSVNIRAKYHLQSRNYYIAFNVADITNGTTYYPSRMFYSLLDKPSSMTALRFIDYRTDDGEEGTGVGELFGKVHLFKPSSIGELSFTTLNLSVYGGDQSLTPIVQGFGCIAPRTLVNTGQFYAFLSKDGIRLWDGGRRNRLTVTEESRIISTDIEPVIKDIIRSGTFINSSMVYYPKKQWLIFSYEDPKKSPHGKANSVCIYDFITGQWHPQRNWNAECWMVQDGIADGGELFYGDSADGYLYQVDRDQNQNDARKEIVVDSMESTAAWQGAGAVDRYDKVEGSTSIKMTLAPGVLVASITKSALIDIGEWLDKSQVTKADRIEFKVMVTSVSGLDTIRVDLEVNNITSQFDTNFTSVTVGSAALTMGASVWHTVAVTLSSFTILDSWTNVNTEDFPFANTLTFYGLRFTATAVTGCVVYIDDVRVVQATENPLNAFRLGKQINFGTTADKRFRQVILNCDKSADSSFYVDVFTDFGNKSKRINLEQSINKEFFVGGFNGVENVTKLDSVDFRVLAATQAGDKAYFAIRPLVVDEKYIYGGDQYNERILKIDKSSMGVIVSSVGSIGTGSNNFHFIFQIAADDDNLYICDFGNHRIKVHSKKDLKFVKAFGTLGLNTTSFNSVTGVAVDDDFLYVGNDGNSQILKLTKSSGGYVTSANLNLGNIGETTLAVDEKYLYVAHNAQELSGVVFSNIILEKRSKDDLQTIDKVTVFPQNSIAVSSYNLLGDISISDDYIFISFGVDYTLTGDTYIQKRLKSDFSIVKEYKSNKIQFAVSFNGISFKAKRKNIVRDLESEGTYVQLKYSDNALDNSMKLYNQTVLLIPEPLKEK